MVQIKLKPCPFCGAEARLWQNRGDNHDFWADGLFFIVADHDWRSCPLYGVTLGHYGGGYNEETGEYSPITDKAVKACEDWNRRADPVTDKTAAPRAEWISVEERLPEVDGRQYLVWDDVQATVKKRFFYRIPQNIPLETYPHIREYFGNVSDYKRFTHWMPVPEPPKGGKHE